MKYRTLGRTGLKVSTISLGGSPFGGVYGDVELNEVLKTITTALDLGINFFDTSPFYGQNRSEERFGQVFGTRSRESFLIATKAGRYAKGYATQESVFDFSYDGIIRSAEESMKRLQVNYIDVLELHDIEFASLDQVVNESVRALEDLKSQGKARFIGVTALPLPVLDYAINKSTVKLDTVLSYCHNSLNDNSLSAYLDDWTEKNQLGVINGGVLSLGLLTEEGPPEWHPASAEIREHCKKASEYCKSQNLNLSKLAVQFSLKDERISTNLIGARNSAQLKELLSWAEEEFDNEHISKVQEILRPIKNKSWPMGTEENVSVCKAHERLSD